MSVLSYMLTILGVVFWLFRAVITSLYTTGIDFPIEPLNSTLEIILIFATIPCMILVLKRNIIGAACYMAIYVSYFGTAIFNYVNNISSEDGLSISSSIDIVMSVVGIVIPVLTFLDIMLNKNRKSIIGGNKSTDWYYKNDAYDRKHDEREDRNQYKIR